MATKEDQKLFWYALSYIHLASDAVDAHVRRIRFDRSSAETAKNPCLSLREVVGCHLHRGARRYDRNHLYVATGTAAKPS